MSPASAQLPRRIGCSCPPSRAAAGYSGRGRVTDGCGGGDPRSSGKTSYRPLVVGRSLVVQSTRVACSCHALLSRVRPRKQQQQPAAQDRYGHPPPPTPPLSPFSPPSSIQSCLQSCASYSTGL